MALSDLEAEALGHLERRGVGVADLSSALKEANLSDEAVQLVDHNLAIALLAGRVGLSAAEVQGKVDEITRACVNGMVNALHRGHPNLLQ